MTRFIPAVLLLSLSSLTSWSQDPSADFFRKGMEAMRGKNYEEAATKFDEALDAAKDPKLKLRAAEALVMAERECKDIEGVISAAEYVIQHTERRVSRSLQARSLTSFLFQNGHLDAAIKRYEDSLKRDADGIVSLTVLVEIYEHTNRKDAKRAEELKRRLDPIEHRLAASRAQQLEALAQQDPKQAAWQWKEAAQVWMEVKDHEKALAAIEASLSAQPENRTPLLSYQYHEGAGDVLNALGNKTRAAEQFELAIKYAPQGILRDNVEKKLKQVKE